MNTETFSGSKRRIVAWKFCLLPSWEKQELTSWKKINFLLVNSGEFDKLWWLLHHNLNCFLLSMPYLCIWNLTIYLKCSNKKIKVIFTYSFLWKVTKYILGLHVILQNFAITNLFSFNCKLPDWCFLGINLNFYYILSGIHNRWAMNQEKYNGRKEKIKAIGQKLHRIWNNSLIGYIMWLEEVVPTKQKMIWWLTLNEKIYVFSPFFLSAPSIIEV